MEIEIMIKIMLEIRKPQPKKVALFQALQIPGGFVGLGLSCQPNEDPFICSALRE
jgi:hypothetical protein